MFWTFLHILLYQITGTVYATVKLQSYCFQRHTMFLIFRNVTCPFLLHFYIHLLYMVNVKEPILLSNELGCSFTAGGSTKLPSQESDECILTQLHTACQISHPLISMYTYVKALKCKGHTCIKETRCSIQPLLINNRCSWPQFSEEGEMSLVLSFSKCKSPADSICLCGCSLNQKSSNRARAISHDSLSFSSQYPTSATSASDTLTLAHTLCDWVLLFTHVSFQIEGTSKRSLKLSKFEYNLERLFTAARLSLKAFGENRFLPKL